MGKNGKTVRLTTVTQRGSLPFYLAVILGVFVLACAATALATSAPALFAARVLAALGAGVVTPVAAGIAVANRTARIDRVLSNSFGFGGSNCALVIGRLP